MMWSDGVERDEHYTQTTLEKSIEQYFAEPRDEELTRLRWENEDLHRQLRERQARRAAVASARQ
jgi:hypothetical protein